MKIINAEQGSQEWLDARLGIPTASEISCLMVKGRTLPPFGAAAVTYLDTLVAERFRGESASDFAGNAYTERGHELEPVVAELYESSGYADGEAVTTCGIILNDYMGASPDRLVGDDGGLEIKTLTAQKMVTLLRTAKIDPKHAWQVQATLWVTGRKWWDYMAYCDGMTPYYERIYPDGAMQEQIKERVTRFVELVDELEAAIISGDVPDKFRV